MKNGQTDYEVKKAREMEWHLHGHEEKAKGSFVRWLVHHPLIFGVGRNTSNYKFPKDRMAVPLWERAQVRASEVIDVELLEQLMVDLQSVLKLAKAG